MDDRFELSKLRRQATSSNSSTVSFIKQRVSLRKYGPVLVLHRIKLTRIANCAQFTFPRPTNCHWIFRDGRGAGRSFINCTKGWNLTAAIFSASYVLPYYQSTAWIAQLVCFQSAEGVVTVSNPDMTTLLAVLKMLSQLRRSRH